MSQFEARRAEKEKMIFEMLKDDRFSTASILGRSLGLKRTATFETLKQMKQKGLLLQAKVEDQSLWGLTPQGAFLADGRHFDPKRVSVITIRHDLAVQKAKVEAMVVGWNGFLAERTLRKMAVTERMTWLQVPDAFAVSPKGRKVALEVERTA